MTRAEGETTSDGIGEYGYVIRWRAVGGGEWRYAATDFDKSLSSASIYTLGQASQQLKQFENAPTAEIVRVRRVTDEDSYVPVSIGEFADIYWQYSDRGPLLRVILMEPYEGMDLVKRVPGAPRWEVVE